MWVHFWFRPLSSLAVAATALLGVGCGGSAAMSSSTSAVHQLPGEPIWRKAPGSLCPSATTEVPNGCAVCDLAVPETCKTKCEAGDGHSCVVLGSILQFGIRGNRDYPRSHALYERGCGLGSAQGCELLASQLARGEGCDQNEQAALELLEPMCREGRVSSCAQAASIHLARGTSGLSAALRLLEAGCHLGGAAVCSQLAEHCTDPACATEARSRACSLGDQSSCVARSVPRE